MFPDGRRDNERGKVENGIGLEFLIQLELTLDWA